ETRLRVYNNPGLCEGRCANPVLGSRRTGSAEILDPVKPNLDSNIGREFPATGRAHGFSDVVDLFADNPARFGLKDGSTLYQIEGSQNGVIGRFEWIIKNGEQTHRMFVANGRVNGMPIIP